MKKGFTLMELMISIVVIGILMTIGYSAYAKVINSAKSAQLIDQLKQIEIGLSNYYRDTGSYPLDLSLLVNGNTSANVTCYDARHKAIGKAGDPYVKQRHSPKGYVDGMEATDNGCIKAVVGVEICMGATITAAGSLESFDTTENVFNKGVKDICNPDPSVGNGGTSIYNVLTVKNIEIDILENVFKSLVGEDLATHLTNLGTRTDLKDITSTVLTPNAHFNIDMVAHSVNYEHKIGVGASNLYETQKAFIYKYRDIY